ncbi:DNA adenine methylase [Halobacillus rhizosphaerae]|uniref:DNA adenine methylase n=1 Tax=Halobacillus rhizosphaerae TaxID=3064889 RepID=UPI00398AECBC
MSKTKKDKLTIPCAYQGGKSRIAKDIVDIFYKENEINEDTKFYDLCCGSGSVSIELINRGIKAENIKMLDKSVWGSFWQSISDGSFDINIFNTYINEIPKNVSEIQKHVKYIYSQPANIDTVYKFLILQASSFGSKAIWLKNKNEWCTSSFRSYWTPTKTSNRKSPVNPMMPMPNTLLERVKMILDKMDNIKAVCTDINDLSIPENNSIIYIDPPYQNTSGYGYDFNIIDYVHKLQQSAKINKMKIKVYVSEGRKLSENSHLISEGRKKGGISGDRNNNKINQEWLNVFD